MHDKYRQVFSLVKNSEALVRQYLPNTDSLMREFEQRVQEEHLQVMLYGAYNAGKSTLINTLLKQESAKVADIPTTDRVDHYDWNGIMLLDTPGVNAPIAHEDVTQAQLKRSALILFVIRDGDMDSKDIYQRLVGLIQQEKPVFI